MNRSTFWLLGLAVFTASAAKIRVAVTNTKPYVYKLSNGTRTGFLVDLLEILSERGRFDYEIYDVPDGQFGERLGGDEWTGLVGELTNGKADMALAPFTLTSAREKVIAFSIPIMHTGIVMMMRKPKPGEKVPASSIIDLPTSDFRFGAISGGSTQDFFKTSDYEPYKKVGDHMEQNPSDQPRNVREAVKMTKDGGYVFVGEKNIIDYYVGTECDLMIVANSINTIGYALGFPKDTYLETALAKLLFEVKEDGTWLELRSKYWQDKCAKPSFCVCEAQSPPKRAVDSGNEYRDITYQIETDVESDSGCLKLLSLYTLLLCVFCGIQTS